MAASVRRCCTQTRLPFVAQWPASGSGSGDFICVSTTDALLRRLDVSHQMSGANACSQALLQIRHSQPQLFAQHQHGCLVVFVVLLLPVCPCHIADASEDDFGRLIMANACAPTAGSCPVLENLSELRREAAEMQC